MAKDIRAIEFHKKQKYQDKYNEYTFQLVHRRFPWWILLFLLPLLLLVKCNKDIYVECVDAETQMPAEDLSVTLDYQAHYLYDGRFLPSYNIHMTQETDAEGKTVFRDLPCSVFSYIFYCLSKVEFTAGSECFCTAGEKYNFHYTRHVKLELQPRREDLHVTLRDLETRDELPDAVLYYTYNENGEVLTDSVHADAAGVATIPNMRYCSDMSLLRGTCYGYADTTKVNVPCRDLIMATDSSTLFLRPIKAKFIFFVKNKETREPIPNATALVRLTTPKGRVSERIVSTSVDGKGRAFYDNAFILSQINIHASKIHFKDGDLEGGPWIVEQFIKQDEDTRTVWLVPEPYTSEFINVDSITGKPISGVRNLIKVTDPNSNVDVYEEISNRNGVFPVTAKEGSRIEIISTKSPEYKQKSTVIEHYKEGEKIPMEPNTMSLKFRTVMQHDYSLLYPNCNLQIRTSSGRIGTPVPTNSGNGEFEVKDVLVEDKLYIVASHGTEVNRTKVNGQTMSYLSSNPSARDIPLPHVFYYGFSLGGDFYNDFEFKGNAPYRFRLEWYECCLGDCSFIEVFSSTGVPLCKVGTNGNPATQSGSIDLVSPTPKVRIHVQDKNSHMCKFKLIQL